MLFKQTCYHYTTVPLTELSSQLIIMSLGAIEEPYFKYRYELCTRQGLYPTHTV